MERRRPQTKETSDLRSLARSDPRLSQLFELSDHLDQLAEEAASGGGLKTPNGNRVLAPPSERPISSAAFSDDASSSSTSVSSAAVMVAGLPPPPQPPPLTSDSSPDPTVAWQTRCVELEWSLQRFRDQAQSIRELLREKVSGEVCLLVK